MATRLVTKLVLLKLVRWLPVLSNGDHHLAFNSPTSNTTGNASFVDHDIDVGGRERGRGVAWPPCRRNGMKQGKRGAVMMCAVIEPFFFLGVPPVTGCMMESIDGGWMDGLINVSNRRRKRRLKSNYPRRAAARGYIYVGWTDFPLCFALLHNIPSIVI